MKICQRTERPCFVCWLLSSFKPKYGFCVVVEHGGSGSKSAAPIAKDLCNKLN